MAAPQNTRYRPAGTAARWQQVSLSDRLANEVNPLEFGAIADGNSHPLSTRYATLAAAQADYPKAIALTQEIDWAALQLCLDLSNGRKVNLCPRQGVRANATLGANITSGATTMTVSELTGSLPSTPFPATVGTEPVTVTGISGANWTITRTAGASHTAGAAISVQWQFLYLTNSTIVIGPYGAPNLGTGYHIVGGGADNTNCEIRPTTAIDTVLLNAPSIYMQGVRLNGMGTGYRGFVGYFFFKGVFVQIAATGFASAADSDGLVLNDAYTISSGPNNITVFTLPAFPTASLPNSAGEWRNCDFTFNRGNGINQLGAYFHDAQKFFNCQLIYNGGCGHIVRNQGTQVYGDHTFGNAGLGISVGLDSDSGSLVSFGSYILQPWLEANNGGWTYSYSSYPPTSLGGPANNGIYFSSKSSANKYIENSGFQQLFSASAYASTGHQAVPSYFAGGWDLTDATGTGVRITNVGSNLAALQPLSPHVIKNITFSSGSATVTFVGGYTPSVNDRILVSDTNPLTGASTGALPSPFVDGTPYYVVSASSGTCTLASSIGGAAITAASAGTGTLWCDAWNTSLVLQPQGSGVFKVNAGGFDRLTIDVYGLATLSGILNAVAGIEINGTPIVDSSRNATVAEFGCNGQAAQAAYASGGAVATTGPTQTTPYGFSTSAQFTAVLTLLNNIRAALVANGIMS